jgi:hypothetical protein
MNETMSEAMDPREAEAKEMERQKENQLILDEVKRVSGEQVLPGRSKFEQQPDNMKYPMARIKLSDGSLGGFRVDSPNGQQLERTISYVRERGDDGKDHNSGIVAGVTERIVIPERATEKGPVQRITEIGKDLHQVHGWEKTSTLTDGQLTLESGKTTEGEKAGETWETKHSVEQKGQYTKKIREATGMHWAEPPAERKLVPFRTHKVNFIGSNGEHILYRSREYDADGKELDHKFQEDIAKQVPPDFKEW